ncbi:MAG: TIR domain-containing protein, partial [Saprospiraceae bacterium]|nr:TIR domain-containing protein [Saprospiraceae bacterium]
MPQPLKTFIIYAREDRDALLELKKQLIPLERREQIAVWYDGEIVAGQEWGIAIQSNLQAADIILLLLSSDFFASDYIEKEELKEALARHENGQSVVVPVVIRHCIWQEHPEIQKLQVLPEGAAPVFSKKHWDSPDEALANVAQGIARISKNRRGAGDIEKEPIATPSMPARLHKEEMQRAQPLPSPTSLSCMVRIKGGTFTMGSPEHEDGRFDNEVQHQVTIADFEIGRYPVTQQLWQEIMGANPSQFKGDKLPVESMIWDEVQEFLKKLNARYPGRNYRL